MKIVIVAPYFYPKIGGMENYVYNISKGLKEKYGWEVVVVTSNHEEKKYKEENIDGMKIYRLAPWFKISNTPINPLWYFQIKKIIKKEKPDIINGHSPVPFISDITSLVAGKIPFITTYHSGSMIKEKSALNPLIFLYESLLLESLFRMSTKIICCSPDYIKRNLKKHKTKVKYIPPGVDTKIFRPHKSKPTNDVLFVGRIEKNSDWKGIKYLLDAISLIKFHKPDISLRLIGSGDRVIYFKKYSKAIGVNKNVTFVGSRTGTDLVGEYQYSKLLVLPSITESESFGIVLVEAMACKKPVIGSKIGGIPYVINHEVNGLLVPPKDSNALADAIVKILKNPELANKMGENGYKKVVSGFTWDKQVEKTHQFFNTL
jgi:glycosyltransferase involved in cell wall biosynthesis